MRQLAIHLGIIGIVAVVLNGCGSLQAVPTIAPSSGQDAATGVDGRALQQQRQKIAELLRLAEQALAEDRLMQPAEDNAFTWYQQVLDLDELNREAHQGMQKITRRYLQLAEQAFQATQPLRAEYFLSGALQSAATPAQVESIRNQYQAQLANKVFVLSVADLNVHNVAIKQHLAEIAWQAKTHSSRLLIVARNDAEGRWIYKQMSDAVDGYRLRGNIELGRHPQVVLIDL